MKQWHMIIDVARCENCNNCSLACKDEHVDNEWPGYTAPQPRHGHRWINVARKERGQFPLIDVAYRPTPCMQCADAPCSAASNGAISRRKDGLVLIDPVKAKGQRHLVEQCPYGAIWWNEERDVPQKCTFCAHLLDTGWKQPRCVQACPTGALRTVFAEESDMARIAETEDLSVLHPQLNTRPRVYYANLYRFDACFIAGTVAVDNDGIVDCFSGARVTLKDNGRTVAETVTDAFGDFKFDGLKKCETAYTVEVEVRNLSLREFLIERLDSSVNIGTICFSVSSEITKSARTL